MSLKGNLEDVSVVDVIQFIYIGGRTGTLGFRTDDKEARLGFQRGRITNAWRTGAPRLGELLVSAGAARRALPQAGPGGAGGRAPPPLARARC